MSNLKRLDDVGVDVKNMSDVEWRMYVDMRLGQLMKQFSNHLHHHWVITVICATAALGGVSSLVVGMMLFLMQKGM